MAENATLKFTEALYTFRDSCRETSGWRNRRLVITIDEFTYLYRQIVPQRVPDTFMKTWKALLEQQLFSAVLAGQDVMPKFYDRFPNEFGVAKLERLTYLSPLNARRLIEEPVRLHDKGATSDVSRFRGRALDRALELTARNPFYVQILGDRLVQHMNATQAVYATEVEVEEAAKELVSGSNALTAKDFDGLLTAGDADTEAIPPEETLAVLRAIANGSRSGSCSRTVIKVPRAEEILIDLLRRDVIEQPQADFFRIRVGCSVIGS